MLLNLFAFSLFKFFLLLDIPDILKAVGLENRLKALGYNVGDTAEQTTASDDLNGGGPLVIAENETKASNSSEIWAKVDVNHLTAPTMASNLTESTNGKTATAPLATKPAGGIGGSKAASPPKDKPYKEIRIDDSNVALQCEVRNRCYFFFCKQLKFYFYRHVGLP